MPDDPSVYGSFMNYFLPQSARVGGPGVSNLPVPGLFDMLGGMNSRPDRSATPEEQERRKQQERQKQMAALSQQGLKMMQPPASTGPGSPQPPPDVPVSPPAYAGAGSQLPQATQVEPTPPRAPIGRPVGYDPRDRRDPSDPRRRNPIAGMPTPFGGFYR